VISQQPRSVRLAAFGLGGLGLVAWIAYASWMLFAAHPAASRGVPSGAILYCAIVLTATVGCFGRAALARRERTAWLLMGLAICAWATGQLVRWFVTDGNGGAGAAPFTTPFLVTFSLLAMAATIALMRERLMRFRPQAFLDGVIAALWLAMAAAMFLAPSLAATRTPTGDLVASAAPAIAGAVLFGLVAGVVSFLGLRPGRSWLLMTLAVGAILLGDVLSLQAMADGTLKPGASPLDILSLGGVLLLTLAGWVEPPDRTPSLVPSAARSLVIPALLGLSAVTVLAVGNVTTIPSLVTALTVATLAAVVLRILDAFIENRRVNRELRTAAALASTDHLTGLANHRSFHDTLRAEVKRVHRLGRPVSLVVLDLDFFKRVNDRFGHQVGDGLLQEVSERLGRQMREGDALARVGGEEFAWILPETDGATAWRVAERAREAISARPFPTVGRVTISAGVCDLQEASTAAELFRMADAALYRAKDLGRNVVFRHTAEMADIMHGDRDGDRNEYSPAHEAVRTLARAVDGRDPVARHHAPRVASLAVDIALALGWTPPRAALLHEAALLHDIGKIGVPDRLLLKPRPLTSDEFLKMRSHASLGGDIVRGVLTPEQAAWVRYHHEHWDGTGYPDGLRRHQIPDGALILAVADAWDVITSGRTYREPWTAEEAIAELRRGADGQWSEPVVDVLIGLVETAALSGPMPEAGTLSAQTNADAWRPSEDRPPGNAVQGSSG
jgi:diguanylate cyclase (GGDEF)-like protein